MQSRYRFIPDPYSGCLSTEDTKKYFSRFAFSVFGFELAAFASFEILANLFVMLVKNFFPGMLDVATFTSVSTHVLNFIAIYAIALPVFCAIAKPLPTVRPAVEKMSIGSFLGGFCVCLVFMQAGSYISNFVITFIQNLSNTTLTNPVQTMIEDSDLWIDLLFLVILAPILEELFFRKLLCSKLLVLGEGYAILISSVIFGLSHGNFFQFAYTALVGAVLAFIYVKTGRLIYTIIYHALLNLLGGIVAPLIIENIDFDKLNEVLGKENPSEAEVLELMSDTAPLLVYEIAFMVLSIIGLVLIFKAIKKKNIRFDSGILPPPKKGRVANLLCTVGSAALVTVYVLFFVLSILPV